MSPNFKTDTQGACFLCLNSKNCSFYEENRNGDEGDGVINSTAIAFKMLLRYLKVDVMKLTLSNISSIGHVFNFNNNLNNRNLSVSLCSDCASVANDFLETFQLFENIRMQLDLCVLQLHEFMEKGVKDPERVRDYESRMNNGNINALINTKIVECLRKKTMEKVSRNVNSSTPRISLRKNCTQMAEGLDRNEAPAITEVFNSDSIPSDCEIMKEHPATEITITNQDDFVPNPIISDGGGSSIGEADEVCSLMDVEENMVELGLPSQYYAEPEPILGEQSPITHTLEMCSYCVDENCYFSSKNSLENHLYNKHPFEVLSNGGLLPPNISEQDLSKALDKILQQWDSSVECHLCRQTGFQSQSQMKTHLLRSHLEVVLKNVEDTRHCSSMPPHPTPLPSQPPPPPTGNGGPLYLKPVEEFWNCIPCGSRFSLKFDFYAHLIYNHPTSAFKPRLPSGTSDQDFNSAVTRIISESMKISGDGDIRSCMYDCLLCGMAVRRIDHLKLHVVCSHINKVIEAICQGKPDTESGNGNLQQVQNELARPWNSVVSGGPSHQQTNFPTHPTTNPQFTGEASVNHQIGTFLSQNQIGTWGFLIPNRNFAPAARQEEGATSTVEGIRSNISRRKQTLSEREFPRL